MWRRAGELEEAAHRPGVSLAVVAPFSLVAGGVLLASTAEFASVARATLGRWLAVDSAPAAVSVAALFYAVAVAPGLLVGTLRDEMRRGRSANATLMLHAGLMTAIYAPFLVLATRMTPVDAAAAARAVALFGVTVGAALAWSAVLGRWYLPAAVAALGGAPFFGFLLMEMMGAREWGRAAAGISSFAAIPEMLSPGGSEGAFAACLVLYGALLAAGLLIPKPIPDER
jgi:hypothetical protein